MTQTEYDNLQQKLSKLVDKSSMIYGYGKERVAYIKGILACKSVLHSEFKYQESIEVDTK